MNIILILIILALVIAAAIFGWFYSHRTRRLVTFAILVLLIVGILFGAFALIRRFWFPLPPF